MDKKFKIAVFASGTGSNFKAIIDYFKNNDHVKISYLVCDSLKAKANQIAKDHNIDVFHVISEKYKTKLETELEEKLADFLLTEQIDLIVLAGYFKIVKAPLLNKFPDRIINIHPSLLPSFKGLNAVKQAMDAGVKITGCTVHFVDKDIDNGKIIAQSAVQIDKNDDIDSLHQKIHRQEHLIYPQVIEKLIKKKF